jgi:Zn-dependent alcohol dehydrogenase
MHAMVLKKIGAPLEWTELPERAPGPGEIRVKIAAFGVCRTDLHVVDGELPDPKTPIIPGHEIVGQIDMIGPGVNGLRMGERVGIPWLGYTCGVCMPRIAKTFAITHFSQGVPAMVVSPPRRLLTLAMRFRSARLAPMWRSPHCFVPD